MVALLKKYQDRSKLETKDKLFEKGNEETYKRKY